MAAADRPPPDALLSPKQVAILFDVSPKTVGRWGDAGLLVARRTRGGHRRFTAASVLRRLDEVEEVGGS
jgi:DNA-binding transcriptional MerR regulator